ncbi:MAG: DMT family transporter [Ignavibacteriae bacterium]|nr:DMT family transporter [Ignavibacteriota bacterium]NOG99925.1 DMT family transporter [Ignavibacteriota bacterium]
MYRFAPLFVVFAAMLWGIDGIVLRPALYTLPVPLVVFVESALVTILLTPFFYKKFKLAKQLNKKDWLAFLGVALFGGAIGTMAITKALFYVDFVNLSIVILIQKLQPLFALFLAAVLLKEKLPKVFFIWAGIAIAGAYLMTFGFSIPEINADDKTPLAALFALIAAASFAASTVFSKRALRNVGFEMGTYLRFLVSSIIMIFIASSLGYTSELSNITSHQFLIFLIIAFTTGGLAIFLYYYGLKNITASVATICELAFPLTAIVLEFVLRDNILSISQWVGVIVLVFSIIKVTSMNRDIKKAA